MEFPCSLFPTATTNKKLTEIKADKTWQQSSQIKQDLEIYSYNMKYVYSYLGMQVAAQK